MHLCSEPCSGRFKIPRHERPPLQRFLARRRPGPGARVSDCIARLLPPRGNVLPHTTCLSYADAHAGDQLAAAGGTNRRARRRLRRISLHAKNQKVRIETLQDHGHGKNDAAHAWIPTSAWREKHQVETTRDTRQTRGARARRGADPVSSVRDVAPEGRRHVQVRNPASSRWFAAEFSPVQSWIVISRNHLSSAPCV